MGKRTLILAGIAVTLAVGALWHGPLGAGARLAGRMEARTQYLLKDWDMTQIRGAMAQAPLRREVILTGPADDFQRGELKRLVGLLPGVEAVVIRQGCVYKRVIRKQDFAYRAIFADDVTEKGNRLLVHRPP